MSSDERPFISKPGDGPEPPGSVDVLIGRIVDGEATSGDRARFEVAATDDPHLWRALADRWEDMDELGRQVDSELAAALAIDLPEPSGRAPRPGWAFAAVGWAALLVLGVAWAAVAFRGSRVEPSLDHRPAHAEPARPSDLTPDEHFDRYLQAPNVLGELPPLLLQLEQQADGRYQMRYERRIEEFTILERGEEMPFNDVRELTVHPSELRSRVERSRQPD